jgi:hypothetical protein
MKWKTTLLVSFLLRFASKVTNEFTNNSLDWEGSTFSSEAMDEAADTGTAEEIDQSKYVELMQGLSE